MTVERERENNTSQPFGMQRPTLCCDDIMYRLFGFVTLMAWTNIFGHWRVGVVDGLTLAPVYWNSSNPM